MTDSVLDIQVTPSRPKISHHTTTSPGNSPKSPVFYDAEEYNITPLTITKESIQPSKSRDRKPVPTPPNGIFHTSTNQSNQGPPSPSQQHSQSPVDPLSEHIRQRASPQIQRSRRTSTSDPVSPVTTRDSTSKKNSAEIPRNDSFTWGSKDKRLSVPFLNRFRQTRKKDAAPDQIQEDADEAEPRPEGADAQLFYESVDNMGFSPKYPQPPRYIKVRAQGKKNKGFDRLFLAQELRDNEPHPSLGRPPTFSSVSRHGKTKISDAEATWALEFSKDGKYLATGGQDKIVRVWAILSTREERRMHERDEEALEDQDGLHEHLSAPVFRGKPYRIYQGHTDPVLDLSWSKNNFLLSSSMDMTVRLWHVSREECLCAFKHTDHVTSIVFHPRDDRFFLAGSLDAKLRLWSIPDKSVAFWTGMPEMCTAVAFTPDGKTAIAGCLTGHCLFYETEGLKYQTQVHAKSRHGKKTRGSKITGIQTINIPPTNSHGDVKVLISSNDSRIRMYNLRDKSVEMKFKGNENTSSQIYGRFSDDAKYVVCGSEDKKVFIWSLTPADLEKKDRRPVEIFEAHNAATTVCAIAPTRTRQLLSSSEDPLYDICNPPPVTLMSKSEVESMTSSIQLDETASLQPTPATTEGNGSFKRPEETPAYVSRSQHNDCGGNIIVTADVTGCIKVFRQDCAYDKRMRSDSESFYRRFSAVGAIRRHSSFATQGSNRSRSRQDSTNTQPSRERILSWRQSITAGGGGAASLESPKVSQSPHSESSKRNASPRLSIVGKFSHRSLLADNNRSGAGSRAQVSPSASASGLGIITSGTPSVLTQESQSPHESAYSTRLDRAQTITNNGTLAPFIANQKSHPSNGNSDSAHAEDGHSEGETSSAQMEPNEDKHVSPVLAREKSLDYWNSDAWHDAITNQLENARRRQSLLTAERADDGLLHRPDAPGATRSYRSSISMLSSELSSASGGAQEPTKK